MIGRTFLLPRQLFVEPAQSARLAVQGARVGYLLACAVRVDDAHERVEPHVDAARLMQRPGGVGLVVDLHGEARLIRAVRVEHDVHGVRRGRQFACPTEFDPPDLRKREKAPFASVRMPDLESRGLGELGRLLPVPAALVPGQSRAMPLPGAVVGHNMGSAGLVEAEEVPVGHVRLTYRLLQGCGGHGQKPLHARIGFPLGEHAAQLRVGLHPPMPSPHEFPLVERPVVRIPACAVQA